MACILIYNATLIGDPSEDQSDPNHWTPQFSLSNGDSRAYIWRRERTKMTGLLHLYRARVQPEWIDYNNHLLDAYYLLIFCNATDALREHLGVGRSERKSKGQDLSTQETHLNYLREIKAGLEAWVETRILGHDECRLHVFHTLYAEDTPDPRATNEQMLINMDPESKKPVAFLPAVLVNIEAIEQEQSGLSRPANAGRIIRLPRK
jgi:acyl-CoA thioester hydrolase